MADHPISLIGRALRRYRRRRRQGQIEIAWRAQVSVNTVGNLERGRGRLSSLRRILKVMRLELKLEGSRARDPLLALRRVRESRGYSQRFVAERLAMSRHTLAAIERGEDVLLEKLEVYARAIDARLIVVTKTRK